MKLEKDDKGKYRAAGLLKKVFGMKDGQTLSDFTKEVRELSESMEPDAYNAFIDEVAAEHAA